MEYSRSLVIKSLFWKFFERSSAQIISFIITIILARLLLPEEYGAISLIMIFVNVCNVIIDGGLNTALIQNKHTNSTDFSTIFYFSILLSVILYSILYLLAPQISTFYKDPILTDVVRVVGLNLVFYAINSIQRAYVAKYMLFNKLFYSSLVAVVISGIIGIFLAYTGHGIWALVVQNLSCTILTCVVMWFTIKWRPVIVFSFQRFKELFNYGWKIFMANFITVIFVEIRKLLIGRMYTPNILAYYEKGEQFPNLIMSNIFTSIQSILLPTFSEFQDDKVTVKIMMRRATKMSCFVIYPLMMGMIVIAEPLVHFLLGEKWMEVVPFIQIMCIANFFRPITISNWEAIKALGYSGISLKLEIIKKIVDITILLISINIGVVAIAWGVVLYNFICVFINLAPNAKLLNYNIKEQLLDAIPTLLITLFMGGVMFCVSMIDFADISLIILQIIIGFSAYMLLCFLFKEESFVYLIHLINNYKKSNCNHSCK